MGVADKTLTEFIDSIPDHKLTFPPGSGTLYADDDYRLDNQGVQEKECGCENLLLIVDKSEKYSPKWRTRII